MINVVQDFLDEYNIKNKKVILGFSSGPDSCALAYILSKLAKKNNLELILAHFNHNWRGEESKSEEIFAFDFAKKINARFYFDCASKDETKTEENARNLRYAFFERAMKEFKTDVVFLAHNKNDNIETAIYRIIKGTGIKGLCSIAQKRDNFYRPLLNITKNQILEFLAQNKIEYKIDSSNEDIKYKRNLIRKEILPIFEKINISYLDSIENLIKNAILNREIVENVLFEFKKEVLVDDTIEASLYKNAKKPLRYEFLNDFLGEKLKYRNYKNIKKIDDFIMNTNKTSQISINRELFLKIRKGKIFFVKHNNYEKD